MSAHSGCLNTSKTSEIRSAGTCTLTKEMAKEATSCHVTTAANKNDSFRVKETPTKAEKIKCNN